MGASIKPRYKPTKKDWLLLSTAYISYVLCLLLFVPLWPALSAGLAGISIVVFGILLLVLTVGLTFTDFYRPYILLAIVTASLGLIIPQVSYLTLAQRHETHLVFNPVDYLTFSGETNLKPVSQTVYKRVGGQSLNIALYKAKDSDERPLVVLLHGGAWRYGNYLETGEWARLLTEAGYHVASIQYRLSTENHTTWQEAPGDINDALSYIRAHPQAFPVDQNRVHLLGQSAGGHLALLEAYRSSNVASVIALYAPIDLAFDYKTSRDKAAEINFIGGTPEEFPGRYHSLSPISHVSSLSPRTLLIYGKNDDLVHPRNAQQLSAALAQYNIEQQTVLIPMTGHSFENQHGGFATQIAQQLVLRFLTN